MRAATAVSSHSHHWLATYVATLSIKAKHNPVEVVIQIYALLKDLPKLLYL